MRAMDLNQAFFLTSAVEKTKTQAQHSIQKLKKKLKLWEAVPKKVNTSRKKFNFDQKISVQKQNSKIKLNTQGKNSSFGRIFPRLRDQVMFKQKVKLLLQEYLIFHQKLLSFY